MWASSPAPAGAAAQRACPAPACRRPRLPTAGPAPIAPTRGRLQQRRRAAAGPSGRPWGVSHPSLSLDSFSCNGRCPGCLFLFLGGEKEAKAPAKRFRVRGGNDRERQLRNLVRLQLQTKCLRRFHCKPDCLNGVQADLGTGRGQCSGTWSRRRSRCCSTWHVWLPHGPRPARLPSTPRCAETWPLACPDRWRRQHSPVGSVMHVRRAPKGNRFRCARPQAAAEGPLPQKLHRDIGGDSSAGPSATLAGTLCGWR